MIDVRIFSTEEIAEINNYVLTQVPQTILPQLFIITEEPIKKIKVFVTIYRIMDSCKDFIEDEGTKEKLRKYLEYSREAYKEIYPVFIKHDHSKLTIEKSYFTDKLMALLMKYNKEINYTSNTFLVFAEKMELIETDTVSGVKLEKDEGIDLYEAISKTVEK